MRNKVIKDAKDLSLKLQNQIKRSLKPQIYGYPSEFMDLKTQQKKKNCNATLSNQQSDPRPEIEKSILKFMMESQRTPNNQTYLVKEQKLQVQLNDRACAYHV